MAGTVTVACRIPSGYMLRTFMQTQRDVPVMAGGVKTITISRPDGWSHKLNGPAHKPGVDMPYQIAHGAALTHGVDADKFAQWLEQQKDNDVVVKGLIFGAVKAPDVVSQAHDHRNEKTGLEPIDPKNLPDEFKRKIEPAVAA